MAQVILRKRVIDCPSASWSVFGSKREEQVGPCHTADIAQIMNVAFGRSWARVSTLPLELTEGLIILMELL